jgi:hypothetical protein
MINEQPPQIKVELGDAHSIECDICQNIHFVPVFIIKHISALISPTGQEMIVPVQVFKCDKCNHVNERFLDGLTN